MATAMVGGRPTAVQFGTGDDTLTMQAGTINGHVEQGLGADTLTMTGGTIGSIDRVAASIPRSSPAAASLAPSTTAIS